MSNRDFYVPVNVRLGVFVGLSLEDIVYELTKQTDAFKVIPEQLGLALQRTQIVRVPTRHKVSFMRDPRAAVAKHDDIQRGFITSIKGDTVFCRYFGFESGVRYLRTASNSEGANFTDIFPYEHIDQGTINSYWEEYVA